ncbi:hypothetical protein TrVE_jg4345 [Triparma verrucosa]|uniref:Uncharacterized protein n=1 Tax=Triparma verrucosa TaxID=1606542 RepID=A0A9W7KXU2_9STRA|nr:hypothetical protein TrVE_jg4345 [Triparma verrucosa]
MSTVLGPPNKSPNKKRKLANKNKNKKKQKQPQHKPIFTDLCVPYLPSLTSSSLNPSHVKSSYLRALHLYSTFAPCVAYFESEITHDTSNCALPPPPSNPSKTKIKAKTKTKKKKPAHPSSVSPSLKILSRHSIHITSSTTTLQPTPHDLLALLPTTTSLLTHILTESVIPLKYVDVVRLKPTFHLLKNHLVEAARHNVNFEIKVSKFDLTWLKVYLRFEVLRSSLQFGFRPSCFFVGLGMGWDEGRCFLEGLGLEGEGVERGLRGWRGRGGGEWREEEEGESGDGKNEDYDDEDYVNDVNDVEDDEDDEEDDDKEEDNKVEEVEDGFLSF